MKVSIIQGLSQSHRFSDFGTAPLLRVTEIVHRLFICLVWPVMNLTLLFS